MLNHDVISMPDTWEYPWYAAWDLAFHCIPLAMVDPDFAKSQLDLMLSQVYLHPSGQIPAYEWNFGDVNPPVHAFATLFIHSVAGAMGDVDVPFLRQSFTRLLLNFTWWVNRKDPAGQERVRGRVPRARQHRRVRPQRGAAHRRSPRAGRRDGVDGDVQPEHARAGAGADGRRSGLRRVRVQVRRALLLDRRRRRPDRRPSRRDVGRRGRVLLRRPAPARRHGRAPQGALAGRAPAAVRDDGDLRRGARAAPGADATDRRRTCSATATCWPTSPTRSSPASTAAVCCRSSTRTSCAGSSHRMLDEERFLGPHGIRSISRVHLDRAVRVRRRGQHLPRPVRAGRVDDRHVRRQLQLARPGVVPHQPAHRPGAAAALPLLRRRLHDRVPDGLRQPDDVVRGRQGARRPARRHVPAPARRHAAGVRRHRAVPATTRTGAT